MLKILQKNVVNEIFELFLNIQLKIKSSKSLRASH